MKKLYQENKMAICEFASLIFTLLMSFILHFAYQWSFENKFVGIFSPINESVWEHGKLLFFPFLIFAALEYFILKPDIKNFIVAKAIPLIFAIPLMIAIFYTYTGILGAHNVYADIAISVGITLWMNWYSYNFQKHKKNADSYIILSIVVIIVLILLVVFTFFPIDIPLFISYEH